MVKTSTLLSLKMPCIHWVVAEEQYIARQSVSAFQSPQLVRHRAWAIRHETLRKFIIIIIARTYIIAEIFKIYQNKTGENQADFSTISIHTSKKGRLFLFLLATKSKTFLLPIVVACWRAADKSDLFTNWYEVVLVGGFFSGLAGQSFNNWSASLSGSLPMITNME